MLRCQAVETRRQGLVSVHFAEQVDAQLQCERDTNHFLSAAGRRRDRREKGVVLHQCLLRTEHARLGIARLALEAASDDTRVRLLLGLLGLVAVPFRVVQRAERILPRLTGQKLTG